MSRQFLWMNVAGLCQELAALSMFTTAVRLSINDSSACYAMSFETLCLILVYYIWAFHWAQINHVARQIFPDRTIKGNWTWSNKMQFLYQPTWAKYTLGLTLAPVHFCTVCSLNKREKCNRITVDLTLRRFLSLLVTSYITFMYS